MTASDEEWWSADFARLSDAFVRGETTPAELTETMLARIAAYDGALHSYASVDADGARRSAAAATEEIATHGQRTPLHGVPISIKDAFFTPGLRTRFGSSIFEAWESPFESTATQRLRDAGAILIGKSTLTEGVYADHHPTVSAPVNPFGVEHWTGTSSSGSAVATTAGLCYASLATDTGGSIRLPAACCGLVGIKPTWSRVSRHGVFPLAESLDHVGPLARTATDAAVILEIVAGADPADPTASNRLVPPYASTIGAGIVDLRIGIDRASLEAHATAEVIGSVEAACAVLADHGATIVPVTMPAVGDVLRGWAVQCAVEAALAHHDVFVARRADFGARYASLLERGLAASGIDLADALRTRRIFTGMMATLFTDLDALVMPTLPVAGPTLAFMDSLGEDPEAILAIGPFTAPFNLCGYPAISVPCGASAAGIPIGLQVVGAPFEEATVLRIAHAYQRDTTWHRRRPDLRAFGALAA